MKVEERINEDLVLEQEELYSEKDMSTRTIITLVVNGERYVLINVKTSDGLSADVIYDENYVVAYTRGSMAMPMPEKIECAYDIKNKGFVYLNKNAREKLEAMYISAKSISLKTMLAIINGYAVPEKKKGEIREAIDYLKGGNENISDEEVIEYIFKKHPELREFSHYKNPLTIYEYEDIVERIGETVYFLHIMPQRLDSVGQQKTIGVHPSTKKEKN